jgi:hypothetical protein
MRNSIRRPGGKLAFSALSVVWMSTAHSTAFTTGELGEHTVARGIDESTVMLLDQGID